MSDHLRSDPSASQARLRELQRYMEGAVLSETGEFICSSAGPCKSSVAPTLDFFEAQMSHVGTHYDLFVDGTPFRIVILGQEYGHGPPRCDFAERQHVIAKVSGLERRYYAEPGHAARNPHMRGTTTALRLLFGLGLGGLWEEEFLELEADRIHVFEAFALVNLLLCSAVAHTGRQLGVPESGGVGKSSAMMRRNCLRHFEATLRILEPTVLVVQGKGVAGALSSVIKDEQPMVTGGELVRATVAGVPLILCRFSHPSAPSRQFAWGDSLERPYLREVVEPVLREARRASLEGS